MRREVQENQRFPNKFEVVLQTYAVPLSDLVAAAPTFDPSRVRSVRFVFDRAVWGTVQMDDIGFWPQANPAFFSARVP